MPFKKITEQMFQKNKEERKIYTTNFDYAVQDLVNKMEEKDIIIPDLQRDYVWNSGANEEKTSRLIESLLLNMPIPTFYFAESDTLKYEVIDGQQRITTFKRYLSDEFALESLEVRHELNGKKFSQLEQIDRDKIRKRGVRAIVIGNESDPEIKFDIFERLNTGSVVLTSQEVRNAIYAGKFNDLLKDLAPKVNEAFHFSTKEDRLRKSAEEMVLRFFAFYTQGEESFGTDDNQLKNFLNKFMETNKEITDDDFNFYKDTFTKTFQKIISFVDNPFKRANVKNDKEGWEGKSNRGIFDMLMLAFTWELDNISIERSEFNKDYEALLREDDNLIKNLSYTNKSSLMNRVSKIRAILRNEK